MLRLTHKDGCDLLVDMSEIRSVKQIIEVDHVYNTQKEYSLITYRDGTTVIVKDTVEEIDNLMDRDGGF